MSTPNHCYDVLLDGLENKDNGNIVLSPLPIDPRVSLPVSLSVIC